MIPNATVNGFGLALTSTGSGNINVITGAGSTVTLTTGIPTAGGTAAFDIQTNGGNITYAGNAAVNDGGFGTTALHLSTTGSGSILVGAPLNPITAIIAGTTGILTETVNGNQNIFLQSGSITTTGTAGIFSSVGGFTGGSGSVNIVTTGGTTIAASGAAIGTATGIGFNLATGTGFVSTDANIGTSTARFANGIIASVAGNNPVTVNQTGGAIFATTFGIDAANAFVGGSGAVSVTTGATSSIDVSGGGGAGIRAVERDNATGGVTVVSAGTINVVASGAGASLGIGIDAEITNSADKSTVNVSVPSGSVTATNIGIFATTAGTGGVNVSTSAGTAVSESAAGAGNAGIFASSTSGNISVNAGDKVTAASDVDLRDHDEWRQHQHYHGRGRRSPATLVAAAAAPVSKRKRSRRAAVISSSRPAPVR